VVAHIFDRFSPFQRSLVSAVSALLGYGSWAYLVNLMHGTMVALKAAFVQGSYSFALTFVMTLLIEAFYRFACAVAPNKMISKVLTIVLTCTIIFSASWWVNAMAGTPEIFNTVILGYIIGGSYTASYVIGLSGEKARKQA